MVGMRGDKKLILLAIGMAIMSAKADKFSRSSFSSSLSYSKAPLADPLIWMLGLRNKPAGRLLGSTL